MRRVSDRRNVFLALGLACGLSWPAGAPAQPQEPPPRAEQGPSDPPALLPLPRRRIGVDPGVDRDPLGLRPSPGDLVREGAFLLNRRGRVVQADDLTWVFVFDADAEGRAEPPMVLLPSLRLTELERLVASREETVTLRLSGMALVYRGRNYLLPTLFHTVADGAGPVDQNRGAAAPTPIQGESPKERGLDPEVDDLLKAMQRDEPQRRTVPPEGAGGTPPANAGAKEELAPLLREGTTVVARRGRVRRGGGGWWVFSPDSGPQGQAADDTPFRLMPSQNLEDIESLILAHGEALVFAVSGPVFIYRERNYLLPTLFRIEPDREGNLTP